MDKSKKIRIAIVGGGIQGLSLAYFLSKKPEYSVTLLERGKNLGGLLGLLEINGMPLEGFYHHWFTSHEDILDLAKELGLASSLLYRRNRIGIFYDNNIYPFTGALDLLRFAPAFLWGRVRLGFAVTILKWMKSYKRLEKVYVVHWLKKICGQQAYEIVWDPLLEGKFGSYKNSVSMAWFWGRVHERGNSPFLVYPRGGFKQLVDKMVEKIIVAGNEIIAEAEVEEIITNQNQISLKLSDQTRQFDKVFITTPMNVFSGMIKGLPAEYKADLEKIKYRAAHNVVLVLKKSLMPQGYYWLNVNDRKMPFLAVVEHTNLIPKEDYGYKTIVYLGNYPDADDSIMKMNDSEIIDLYSKFLPLINKDFQRDWIEKSYIFKDTNAQPVVGIDYKANIPPYQTPIPNLYLVTMAQIYPWDRGTNNAIKQAKEVVSQFNL